MHEVVDLLSDVVLWFVAYSFAGWAYETALVSIQQRRFVNRGFLNGPLCPIYGCGTVLAALLLPMTLPDWAVFLASGVVACLLEYVTSVVMEKAFHARWWDYSSYKFNYQGRVCLLGFLVFGVAGLAIVRYAQPAVSALTGLIPWPWKPAIAAMVALAVIIDFVVSVVGTYGLDKTVDKMSKAIRAVEESTAVRAVASLKAKAKMPDGLSTRLSRLRELAQSALNSQQKRMLRSFPHLRLIHVEDRFTADLKAVLAGKWREALRKIDKPSAGMEPPRKTDGATDAENW